MVILFGFSLLCAGVLIFQTGILFINYRSQKRISRSFQDPSFPVPHKAPLGGIPDRKLVSVLIPARNEADRMGPLLDDLMAQDCGILEILVYDDGSTDGTDRLVRAKMSKDPRIRLMSGSTLPEGWSGKNYACHRLAQEARGRYFLFLDADVRLGPRLIPFAVDYLRRYDQTLPCPHFGVESSGPYSRTIWHRTNRKPGLRSITTARLACYGSPRPISPYPGEKRLEKSDHCL